MKKLKKSEIILICILLVVLVGYLYYLLFLKNILSERSMVKANIQSKNDKLQELKLVRVANSRKEKQYEKLQEDAKQYVELITQSDRLPKISYDLKKYLDNHQVLLTSFAFQEGTYLKTVINSENKDGNSEVNSESFDNIRSINANLAVEGEYKNVRNLIDTLEKDKRLIYINSVVLSSRQEGSSLVQANIQLSYFSKAEFEENVDYEFNNGIYGNEDMFK